MARALPAPLRLHSPRRDERRVGRPGGNQPDIVVSDIMMPHMDGREMVRRIRAGGVDPVILLTQIDTSASVQRAGREPTATVRPSDPQELVSRIRAVLRRSMHSARPLTAERLSGSLCSIASPGAPSQPTQGSEPGPRRSGLLDYLMTHPGELHTRERLLWCCGASTARLLRAARWTTAGKVRAALGGPSDPVFIGTVPPQYPSSGR